MLQKHVSGLITPLALLLFVTVAGSNLCLARQKQNASPVVNKEAVNNEAPTQTTTSAPPAKDTFTVNANPRDPDSAEARPGYTSDPEFFLTLMVCVVSGLTLLMQFLLLRKSTRLKSEDTSRVFGMTLIIMGTLFSVSAGFSAEQIAPAMGLFGTIAGYLLGRADRKDHEENA